MRSGASDDAGCDGERGLIVSDRELLLVADLTAAYCARSRLEAAEVPVVIRARVLVPAATIRASVRSDYLICLEDGRKFKMLRRHLRGVFNLAPAQYRAKWGLSPDYPMVAPNNSMVRSRLALTSGLGRLRARSATTDAEPDAAP